MRNILLIYRGQVFDTEIKPRLDQYKNDNVVLVIDNKLTRKIIGYITKDYEQKINIVTIHEYLNQGVVDNMKFDVTAVNPPYQLQVGEGSRGKTEAIWHKVLDKCLKQSNKGGELVMINPGAWRNVSGIFKPLQQKILSLRLHKLEMNSVKKGKEVFGVNTDYDVLYLTNEPRTENFKTKITDYLGNEYEYDLSDVEFIPNANLDKVYSLVAKPNEERVEVLYSSSKYEIRNKHMSSEKDSEFKYPCAYTVGSVNPNFWYSNTNKLGHFGVPKVIWGNGLTDVIVDKDGQYGLTQFAYAIVDDVENLEMIQRALKSKDFIKNIMGYQKGVGHIYNRKVIETFRKDFWKEFV